MDNVIKNYEEVLEKPPSTRIYFKFLKHKWDSRKFYKKQKIENSHETHKHNDPPEGIEVVSFAIIVDGVVVDVMNVQKEFAEILHKEPKFVFISPNDHRPHIGWLYQDDKFVTVEDISISSHVTIRG